MVKDVKAHQGVMITNNGYSQAAINRVYYAGENIELDIINFDEIENFQGFAAVPYSGDFGVIIRAPFGWVVDWRHKIGNFPSIIQRGITFEGAKKRNEWMYFDVSKRPIPDATMNQAIEQQNVQILRRYPRTEFEYKDLEEKTGKPSKLRKAYFRDLEPPRFELASFVDLETHLLIVYMITPIELVTKNQRKLEYLVSNLEIVQIEFNNTQQVNQLLQILDKVQGHKKADVSYELGKLCWQMNDIESATKHFRNAADFSDSHSGYFKILIDYALTQKKEDLALEYTNKLIALYSTSSENLIDLGDIYSRHQKGLSLLTIFEKNTKLFDDDLSLGNLFYHIGFFKRFTDRVDEANDDFKIAKKHLVKVLPADHAVFDQFKKLGL